MEHWIDTATLQFPFLYTRRPPHKSNPNGAHRFAACIIMNDNAEVSKMYAKIQELMQSEFQGAQVPMSLRSGKEKLDKPEQGFTADNWFFNCSSADQPYTCVGTEREILPHDVVGQNLMYPGANVRVLVDIWAQKASSEPPRAARINVELKGVQWLSHGAQVLAGGSKPTSGADFGIATTQGVDPTGAPPAPAPVPAPAVAAAPPGMPPVATPGAMAAPMPGTTAVPGMSPPASVPGMPPAPPAPPGM